MCSADSNSASVEAFPNATSFRNRSVPTGWVGNAAHVGNRIGNGFRNRFAPVRRSPQESCVIRLPDAVFVRAVSEFSS